jgi:hypothetical protein
MWLDFCARTGENATACSVTSLLNFLASLVGTRLHAYGSVASVAASVSVWFRFNSVEDLTKHAAAVHLLRGAKRQLGLRVRRMRPISPFMLESMARTIDVADGEDVAGWALCLTAWWGMLRKSSLLPSSAKGPALMRRDNLRRDPRGLVLRFSTNKTIQFREREHLVLLPELSRRRLLCPVRAMERPLRVNGVCGVAALWSIRQARGRRLVAGRFLDEFIRRKLAAAGLASKDVSAHSLRRGGATWAALLGVAVTGIKQIGDWRSEAVQCYLPRFAQSSLASSTFAGCVDSLLPTS